MKINLIYFEQSEHPLYELRSGIVCRKDNNQLLFFIPTNIHTSDQVVRAYDNDGINKTIDFIKQVY